MATLTYHRKPNGTTYVYRQESYWDKSKGRSATKQVCVGKLDDTGEIIYNKRFSDPAARDALERGEVVSESIVTGQSLILAIAASETGLDRVVRKTFGSELSDELMSLAYAVCASGDGTMYAAPIWIEDNDCPVHANPPTSPSISRTLASVSQQAIEGFLASWMRHRSKGKGEQYCFDITSVSSYSTDKNPFVEWGYNRDKEKMAQIDLALLTEVKGHLPTYYEILPGSMSDVRVIQAFTERMKNYEVGRIRMLLDRGFYSKANLKCLMDKRIGFYIPAPAGIKWAQELIDAHRDAVEMPEHIISVSDDRKDAVYGMTVLDKLDGRRVWKHLYYDSARRTEHILSLFANLATWEDELMRNDIKEANQWAYDTYFTWKTTPKRGRQVKRNQQAINAYKTDRAGYWVIITNCEKDCVRALEAYRKRSGVEQSFDDLKNELDMNRLRTHNSDTMRGRVLVQFLALVLTSQIRATLNDAWARRDEFPKDIRLSRRYSLRELMLRLGSYRKTRFSGKYGEVVSTPTKAQREIFAAFGLGIS
jgi:transposase